MKKIIITGANGQLGQEIKELSIQFPSYHFYFFERKDLDISDQQQVAQSFAEIEPDWCINCAAYTAVDKAESEKEAAFKINAGGVKNIAAACVAAGTQLIHISTDYVFNGTGQVPYKEDDNTNPTSVYGSSKLEGERLCLAVNSSAVIIRTSWVYSMYGNNFVKTMLRLMQTRPEVSVVNDQWGSPTYAADLAKAIMQIIESGVQASGIYHFSNEGIINWYQFAQAIAAKLDTSCVLHAIPSEQYPTPVERPKYSVLNKEKIQNTFGIQLNPWEKSLQQCLLRLDAVGK